MNQPLKSLNVWIRAAAVGQVAVFAACILCSVTFAEKASSQSDKDLSRKKLSMLYG